MNRSAPASWSAVRSVALACVLLVAAGCNGSGKGSPGGGLGGALDILSSPYLILDLATGVREPVSEITGLTTDPRFRTTHMVFRRIDGGTARLGSPSGSPWAQPDETERTIELPGCYIGVFEVTRAQWQVLGGGDPAAAVTPAALASAADPHVPVHGLSLDAVRATLGAWHRDGSLGVPSADQWERACRAGTTTLFSWGDATVPATVRANAVVANIATTAGLQPVAGRAANAWGLFDMHGNAWEWTDTGQLCGGSWNDTLPMARSANRMAMDPHTPYALAGVRLVYAP